MTRREHLLTKVSEECHEVGQRACKALRFGEYEVQPDPDDNPRSLNNRERLYLEWCDLCVAMEMLGIPWPDGFDLRNSREKFEKYLAYSKQQGTLTD